MLDADQFHDWARTLGLRPQADAGDSADPVVPTRAARAQRPWQCERAVSQPQDGRDDPVRESPQ